MIDIISLISTVWTSFVGLFAVDRIFSNAPQIVITGLGIVFGCRIVSFLWRTVIDIL